MSHMLEDMNYDRNDGFSLVEILVTLVIISTVLLPLFQVQQTLNRSSIKLSKSTKLVSSSQTVLSFLSSINPKETPKGSQSFKDDITLKWDSQVIETFVRPGTVVDPQKEIGLYRLTYRLVDKNGQELEEREIKQIGWEIDNSFPS